NGTGKTTILDTIYSLLAMAERIKPDWIHPNHQRARIFLTDLPFTPTYSFASFGVGNIQPVDAIAYLSGRPPISSGPEPHGPTIHFQLSPADAISTRIEQAKVGEIEFPNCLYFPSECRELASKKKGQVISEEKEYKWVYRFSDTQKWQGSLESFLVAMNYRDLLTQGDGKDKQNEFQQFLEIINNFLQNKRITGIDPDTFRIQIVSDKGGKFGIDALSSGEKQILLLLGEIQRRIHKGSILLIDEPEIHLHPRWQRLLIRALSDLCEKYDAQFIATTHSQEIADAVFDHELVLLDEVFAREKQS
ncbi:MAG: ATP-binding protein, partial [Chloroflexi bacterium]|nr:ATP-binding protein [Chloroflexota bacterium]